MAGYGTAQLADLATQETPPFAGGPDLSSALTSSGNFSQSDRAKSENKKNRRKKNKKWSC